MSFESYELIKMDQFNETLKVFLDTGTKDLDSLSKEEENKLLKEQIISKIEKEEEKRQKEYDVPLKKVPFYPYDINRPEKISENQLIKSKNIMSQFAEGFLNGLGELIGQKIELEKINVEHDYTEDEIIRTASAYYTMNYKQVLDVHHMPFYVFVNPALIDYILLQTPKFNEITKIKNEICKEFVFDGIISGLGKYFKTDILNNAKESKLFEIKYNKSPFVFIEIIFTCSNTRGSLFFATPEDLWLKIIGEKQDQFVIPDYTKENSYAIIGETNISEEHGQKLAVGEKIVFTQLVPRTDSFAFEKAVFITKGAKKATASVGSNKENFMLQLNKDVIDVPENKYMDNNVNNLFLILGSTYMTDEEISLLKEKSLITLGTKLTNDLPLVYKNKVIGLSRLYNDYDHVAAEITTIFDRPVQFMEK